MKYYHVTITLYECPYFRFAEYVHPDMLSYQFRRALEWIEQDHKDHPSQAIKDYRIEVSCGYWDTEE